MVTLIKIIVVVAILLGGAAKTVSSNQNFFDKLFDQLIEEERAHAAQQRAIDRAINKKYQDRLREDSSSSFEGCQALARNTYRRGPRCMQAEKLVMEQHARELKKQAEYKAKKSKDGDPYTYGISTKEAHCFDARQVAIVTRPLKICLNEGGLEEWAAKCYQAQYLHNLNHIKTTLKGAYILDDSGHRKKCEIIDF